MDENKLDVQKMLHRRGHELVVFSLLVQFSSYEIRGNQIQAFAQLRNEREPLRVITLNNKYWPFVSMDFSIEAPPFFPPNQVFYQNWFFQIGPE